ncbi:adenylate kinase [Giardia muris]|uniref:Adenylate kinase isoenzyme 6 homolog n=1 Tax=Giardia muris TaxID=5742 RepID=A0A4Z1SVG7_GIAMU|nr:adenylate kinase [Giardia muris]|eukprot:TNJ27578.1 adenylate kinase [Giardia muris]
MRLLITGVPGVGKTALSQRLIGRHPEYVYVNVSELAITEGFTEGYDQAFDTAMVDEERLLDALEEIVSQNKCLIVDHHSCGRFAVRWFDAVLLLHASTDRLHARLVERGYSERKIRENIEAEILMVTEEDVDDFGDRVIRFICDTPEDQDAALDFLEDVIAQGCQ